MVDNINPVNIESLTNNDSMRELDSSNSLEASQITRERCYSNDTEDSFDSTWDYEPYRNPESVNTSSSSPCSDSKLGEQSKGQVFSQTRKIVKEAKCYMNTGIKTLSKSNSIKSVCESKPKPQIVKSDQFYTTNKQVQNMMQSSNSLKDNPLAVFHKLG